MKKKIIPILLCVAMVFTLAGCGSSSDDEEESVTQEEAEESADENANAENVEDEGAEVEESVVDQVAEFRFSEVEDNIAFWNIYMKEDADYDHYNTEDYVEILKACLDHTENKEDGVIFYGIMGYTQDGKVVFSWNDYGTEDEIRQIEQFVWREGQTNPDYYYWQLSGEEMQEIYSGLDEQE